LEVTKPNEKLRRRWDSNPSTGLCRPLPNHSATPPEVTILLGA
jgi:hypothetical protein